MCLCVSRISSSLHNCDIEKNLNAYLCRELKCQYRIVHLAQILYLIITCVNISARLYVFYTKENPFDGHVLTTLLPATPVFHVCRHLVSACNIFFSTIYIQIIRPLCNLEKNEAQISAATFLYVLIVSFLFRGSRRIQKVFKSIE